MAYFERLDAARFRPTEHVGGAWNEEEQHIAPALGLMTHLMELDRDQRRDDGLRIGRLSYDILGPVPLREVEVAIRVLRPGRTIELVEVELSHNSRAVVLLRGWLLAEFDTAPLEGTPLQALPGPQNFESWDATDIWPGGFIRSIDGRRRILANGHAHAWLRTPHGLVAGEPVSDTARFMGLADVANGLAVRVSPRDVAYPNLELSAHLFRDPSGDWVGYDTTASFGPDGRGVTRSIIHDQHGPVGAVTQGLTVRPQR